MLVGIIPLSNIKSEHKNPSGFANLLVTKDMTVLQRSIEECSLVGCDIIYIFAGRFVQKYVKAKYSSYIFDIMDVTKHYSGWKTFMKHMDTKDGIQTYINSRSGHFKVIPIVFHSLSLPITMFNPVKSQLLSAFFGAYEVSDMLMSLSETLGDVRFFFSFPQTSCLLSACIHTKEAWTGLVAIRELLKGDPCKFVADGLGISDGVLAPFTSNVQQIETFRKHFFKSEAMDKLNKTVKHKEFKSLSVFKNNKPIDVGRCFTLNEWVPYCEYLNYPIKDYCLNVFYKDILNKSTGYKLYLTSSFDNVFKEMM